MYQHPQAYTKRLQTQGCVRSSAMLLGQKSESLNLFARQLSNTRIRAQIVAAVLSKLFGQGQVKRKLVRFTTSCPDCLTRRTDVLNCPHPPGQAWSTAILRVAAYCPTL